MKLSAAILLTLFVAVMAFAADFSEPVLVTSIGQSADLHTAKLILKKAGIDSSKLVVEKLAGAANVPANGTIAMVVGASNKGLGEARISVDSEIARAKAIIADAKTKKAKIMLIHIGGKERRGPQSDGINKIVAESADYFLVLKSGDADNFFANLAKANKKPYIAISKAGEGVAPLKTAFGK